MTTGTTLTALALSLTCGLAMTPASAQKRKPAAQNAAPAVNAEQLFTANCAPCHVNGNSETKELNFADGEWRHGSSLNEVIKTITGGVPGTAMLPWKERFTEKEIVALAKYVRSFDKSLAPAGRNQGRNRK
jgi:mono/diheme cytochrome c family protein